MTQTTAAAAPEPEKRPGTDVAVYDRVTNIPDFIASLGDAIHRSGMFGCESPSQGKVMAMECVARRLPPLALAERYHLIKGKLSMKADAMLADFRRRGGRSKIIQRDGDRAEIELSLDGEKQRFSLDWEEAQHEPFVYCGKEDETVTKLATSGDKGLKLKPKYATPRARSQMLWARVVSDGVRAMAPEVVSGVYTPEEMSDVTGMDDVLDVPAGPAGAVPADDIQAAEVVANAGGQTTHLQTDEAQAEQAAKQAAEAMQAANQSPAPAPAPAVSKNGKATAEQIAEARELVTELKVSRAKLEGMLARAQAKKVSELPREHCEALLDVLRKEKAKRAGN